MFEDQQSMTNAQLQAQLALMYNRYAMRITAPLQLIGRAMRACKQVVRQATTSPRAFAQRAVLALLRFILPTIKRHPVLMAWARRVYRRFPAVGERVRLRLRPTISTSTESSSMQPVATTRHIPYTWDTTTSPVRHFKAMLSHELQQRQNKKDRVYK